MPSLGLAALLLMAATALVALAERLLALAVIRGAVSRPEMRMSITIEAPIERVWEYASDIHRQPEWMHEMKRVEMLTPGPIRVGSRGRATVRIFGISTTDEVVITAELGIATGAWTVYGCDLSDGYAVDVSRSQFGRWHMAEGRGRLDGGVERDRADGRGARGQPPPVCRDCPLLRPSSYQHKECEEADEIPVFQGREARCPADESRLKVAFA